MKIGNKESLFRGLVILSGLLSFFVLVLAVNAIKENKYIGIEHAFENTITVEGEGEASGVPDLAQFTFTVTEEGDTTKRAQERVAAKVASALEAIRDMDVEEKDIKTQSFNVYPRYEYIERSVICPEGFPCPPKGERELVGYEASQSIEIKLRDTDKSGELLEILAEENIGQVFGPNFTFDDDNDLEREARKKAIEDAKNKAKELAGDLGVDLGRIVEFSESGTPRFFGKAVAEEAAFGGDAMLEIPAGENKITKRVTIVYEIR